MIVDNGKYYLYRHIRHDNNTPFYIGIGTKVKKQPYNRANAKSGRNSVWNRIVNKTMYSVEILLESDNLDFIKEKEREFISIYGYKYAEDKKGYLCNMTSGGEHYIPTDVAKRNMSKGHLNMSEEIRKKISNTLKGKPKSKEHIENFILSRTGVKLSKEHVEKITLANKGKKRSSEHCKKQSERMQAIREEYDMEKLQKIIMTYKFAFPKFISNYRIVYVYDNFKNLLIKFPSEKEASKVLNISVTYIRANINKKSFRISNLIFSNDYETCKNIFSYNK